MAGNEAGKPRAQMPDFEFIDKNVNGNEYEKSSNITHLITP